MDKLEFTITWNIPSKKNSKRIIKKKTEELV